MSNALTTDRVGVTVDSAIIPDDYNNARADLHSTAEGFWDDGTPDIPSSMRVKGVHWSDPTSKALRLFRQTAIGADSRAMSSPIRPIWHYDDQTGEPAIDARAVEGDLLLWDDGTNDRFLKSHDGAAWYGVGVRADYRTAATALSTTQNSDAVAWRSSRWVTSAAKYRQWRAVARGDASDANNSFLSLYAKREEGSEYKIFDFQHLAGSNSKFYVYGDGVGSVPGIGFTADPAGVSPGSISCVFGPNGTDIDGTAVWFKHGDSTRHVRWRFFGVDDETTGTGAEVLAVTYQQAASGGETTKRSPSFVHRGAAWSGAASVEVAAYSQLVPTSTTAGYLETGFDFGSGVYQFHHDGLLGIAGSSTGGVLLSRYTAATGGAQLVDSSLLKFRGAYWNGAASADIDATTKLVTDATTPAAHLRTSFTSGTGTLDLYDDGGVRITQDPGGSSNPAGQLQLNTSVAATALAKTSPGGAFSSIGYSWDGAASQPRVMGWYTNVDDPADATDVWSHRLIAVGGGSPVDVMFATSAGWLGLGASPAVAAHVTETTTITGGVTDGYTASLRLQPTYTAATAQTVTRHNYLDVKNVTLSGAGPAALTDACLIRYDAAAGTHKALDSGTTKTTPGGVDAWEKRNVNGTIYYAPLYTSKTA